MISLSPKQRGVLIAAVHRMTALGLLTRTGQRGRYMYAITAEGRRAA